MARTADLISATSADDAVGYLFAARDGTAGNELWIAGPDMRQPHLLKDINPGIGNSDPTGFFTLQDGRVAFVARDDVHGPELWVTDGTEAGTVMVKDISYTGEIPTENFIGLNGKLLFTVGDMDHGSELWVSDGTAYGTHMLRDINPGFLGSNISGLTALGNGKVIFSATTSEAGSELWVTDGTTAGTMLLRDMNVGPYGTHVHVDRIGADHKAHLTAWTDGQGEHWLDTGGEWVTDGTVEGTLQLSQSLGMMNLHPAGSEGNLWVYLAYSWTSEGGFQLGLYGTDGMTTTTLLAPPEKGLGGKGAPEEMFELGNGKVIFTDNGNDLWVTDGTKAGTLLIGDDVSLGAWGDEFAPLGNGKALFLNANLDYYSHTGTADLWVTDGTAAGTYRIMEQSSQNPVAFPESLTVMQDGSVVFTAGSADGGPTKVWMSDLTPGSLHAVEGITAWGGTSFHAIALQDPISPEPPDVPTGHHDWAARFPLFDKAYYLDHNPDVAKAGIDPLQHFLQSGWAEGRDPNSHFDVSFYLNQNPDVRAAGLNAFQHYLNAGAAEGRAASYAFDGKAYLAANPDVVKAGVDALTHYLKFGEDEGRQAFQAVPHATGPQNPLVNADWYFSSYQDVAREGVDPTTHYMTSGWREGRDPDAFFDTSYYLESNADVAAAGVNPLEHYLRFGGREGRDPSARFDSDAYLQHNPDVAASGMNPLLHYLQHGLSEGRDIFHA